MICNMSLLVMWHYWLLHYIITTASSIAPLHSPDQDNWNDSWSCDATGTSVGISWYWWHHLIKPLHFPGQDNWNEVPYDFFGQAMPLASVSLDDKWHCQWLHSFIMSRQSKWSATWLLWSCDAIGVGKVSCNADYIISKPMHSLC